MEPCPVEALATGPLVVGAEEDACCKDALESLDEAAVVNAVLWKLQEFKQLSSSLEVNDTALLLHCQRRDPDRDQAVLTEGQTITRMSDDLQNKIAVLTAMNQLT